MTPLINTVERVVRRIADRAHGVVTREELLAAGVTADQVRDRVRSGALIVVYRGVYRVGHAAPSTEAHYLAAVKACGPGSRLSGRAAAYLLGILRGKPRPPEVTTPNQKRPKGVRVRRTKGFHRADVTTWRGIPTTSVPRTIVDLAATLPEPELARVFHEAGVHPRHNTKPSHIEAVLARRPNTPGAAELRRVIHGDTRVLLSKLEARFIEWLKHIRRPLPITNRRVGAKYVDCRWPEHTLTVELDSYRFHNSRHSWEQDHQREREARARGDEFRRYTWADNYEHPEPMLADLCRLLPEIGSEAAEAA